MVRPQRQFICDCCALHAPAASMMTWEEQRPARRLKALGPHPSATVLDDEPPGPYRSYVIEHQHQVCPSCHAHLRAGGEFHAVSRNAGRLGVLILVVVLALLIAAGPVLLPHLLSALWLAPGEGGR